MLLPEEFTTYTRQLMGDERYERFIAAMGETPPVSIRLNPLKTEGFGVAAEWDDGMVPWCPEGHYLKSRPDFTFDPLLHAGAIMCRKPRRCSSAMCFEH